MIDKLKKTEENSSYESHQKDVEYMRTCYREKLRKIAELETAVKEKKKRLGVLQKKAEFHEASLYALEGSEGVHKIREDGRSSEELSALCQLLKKDLKMVEELTETNIKSCKVEIVSATSQEILKMYTTSGRVRDIEFDLQIVSKFEVSSGIEREVQTRKIEFTPMASQFVDLQEYLKKNRKTYILLRALRTFQDLSEEMKTVKNELSKHEDLTLMVKRHSITFSFTPSVLRNATGAERADTTPSLSLQWKIIFRESVDNFTHWFDLDVPEDVSALYSTSEVFDFLDGEKPVTSADDVMTLFNGLLEF